MREFNSLICSVVDRRCVGHCVIRRRLEARPVSHNNLPAAVGARHRAPSAVSLHQRQYDEMPSSSSQSSRAPKSLFELARQQARDNTSVSGEARALPSGANTEAMTTPAKKKLRLSCRAESSVLSPGGGDSVPDSEVCNQCTERGKVCFACDRAYGPDCSFLVPQQPFAWMYSESRGNYCRDCGNLYRISMKHSMTIAVLERYLMQPVHKLAWMAQLASYLSLRYDGCSHITLPMLQQREKMLRWVFDLLQMPFPGMVLQEA